jgi:hypothetical protein
MPSVLEIPKSFTPAGGYGTEMPAPVLAGCTDALAENIPDFRGLWRAIDVQVNGVVAPPQLKVWQHVERIEQAGNRVVITAGGVVHDMYADGTFENGVNDVMAVDFKTSITVAATFENDVLVLRPRGFDGVEIKRWFDGEHLMWEYSTAFLVRLERVK